MSAGKQMNWCARCHHAIIPVGGLSGGWAHFSEDDWAGSRGECSCANSLERCNPERRFHFHGPHPAMVIADEIRMVSASWVTGAAPGRLGSIT